MLVLNILSITILILYLLALINTSFDFKLIKSKLLFPFVVIVHSIFLFFFIFEKGMLALFNNNNYFFILSYLIALAYQFYFSKYRVKYFEIVITFLCFIIFAASSLFFENASNEAPFDNTYFTLFHFIPMLFGEAFLLINIALSFYYLFRERQIRKTQEITFNKLSLEKLKQVIFIFAKSSFILISVGIISGFLWYAHSSTHFFLLDLIILYFVANWLILLILIFARKTNISSIHKQIGFFAWSCLFVTMLFLILRLNAGNLLHGI